MNEKEINDDIIKITYTAIMFILFGLLISLVLFKSTLVFFYTTIIIMFIYFISLSKVENEF